MKLKIVITGPKIHDVGYRPFLIALADEFELDGIGLRNAEVGSEQAVRVKAEGDAECVQEFEKEVRTRLPEGAIVSNVKSEPFDGRVPSIERTAITNMNTQLAKGIKRLDDLPEIKGELTGIKGELTGIKGELTGIKGELVGIKTNTDLLPAIKKNTDAIPDILDEIKGMKEELQPGFSVQI